MHRHEQKYLQSVGGNEGENVRRGKVEKILQEATREKSKRVHGQSNRAKELLESVQNARKKRLRGTGWKGVVQPRQRVGAHEPGGINV